MTRHLESWSPERARRTPREWLHCRTAIVLPTLLFACATVCHGANIQAASTGGLSIHPSIVPTSATGEVLAYSECLNFVVNQTVTLTATAGGLPIAVAPPVNSPRRFVLLPPLPTVPTPTNAVVTSGVFGKFAGLIEDIRSSSTGTVAPIGSATGHGLLAARADGTTYLSADANVTNNFVAFGRAEDPMTFAAGDNLMTDEISGIVLRADAGTIGAEFEIEALSTLPGLAELYSLKIFAPGGIASIGDLIIDFTSNAALGLDDDAIADALRDQFSVSGNTATMDGSVTLSYLLHGSTSYDVGYGVGADAAASPEPATLSLIGGALLLAAGWRRRRRA